MVYYPSLRDPDIISQKDMQNTKGFLPDCS